MRDPKLRLCYSLAIAAPNRRGIDSDSTMMRDPVGTCAQERGRHLSPATTSPIGLRHSSIVLIILGCTQCLAAGARLVKEGKTQAVGLQWVRRSGSNPRLSLPTRRSLTLAAHSFGC